MFVTLTLLALLIEAAIGYPKALFERIGHPVVWVGSVIRRSERIWNNLALGANVRRLHGVLALATMMLATAAAAMLVAELIAFLPGLLAAVLLAVVASSLLAQRALYEHVVAVAIGLETGGLDAGRAAVSQIVGRDPQSLDEGGVCRAAIESLAENFSDGIVAPAFWLCVLGLPGAALYKAINTADSMIGHKSERYLAYGWASARLDDLVNLPASRLSVVWIVAAAWVGGTGTWRAAIDTVLRDAGRHRSPNAGWPESAMAGALGVRLAGPRVYGGTRVDDCWMGDGRAAATAQDIRAALALYHRACVIQIGVLAVLVAIGWVLG